MAIFLARKCVVCVCGVVSLSGPPPPEAKFIRTAILAQVDSSLCARRAILVCCFLFCVSSKSYITLSHGAQGMAFSRRPRWLFPGHSRATSAVSPVATCFAAVSSRSGAESAAFQPKLSPVVKTSGTRPSEIHRRGSGF